MKLIKNKAGFTLLEIIIVIIIVGVLASLALPRFFATVEFSRGQEALTAIAAVRGGLERCFVAKGGATYVGCATANIDTGDPLSGAPNAHFAITVPTTGATNYAILATRNAVDGGTVGDTITVTQTAAGTITRSGTTAFKGIN